MADIDSDGPILMSVVELNGKTVVAENPSAAGDPFMDTMQLAIDKTIRDGYLFRSGALCGIASLSYWGANAFDNDLTTVAFGAFTAITALGAVYQGVRFAQAGQKYGKTLDEVVSHGWAPREDLKKIDYRYL